MAVVVGMAIFTVLFWLVVAAQLGRLEPVVEGSGKGYATAVAWLYFAVTLIGAPAATHTVGELLERRTASWKRDDAVVAFAGLGLLLAIPPVLMLAGSEPAGAAVGPAVWLFGVPVFLAVALTRFFLDTVMRSERLTRAAAGIALLPPVVVLLFLLGLYVARGSGEAG
jgi:hypothetical protein